MVHVERDVEQDLHGAVRGVEVADLEHAARWRSVAASRARSPRSSSSSSTTSEMSSRTWRAPVAMMTPPITVDGMTRIVIASRSPRLSLSTPASTEPKNAPKRKMYTPNMA